MKHNLQIDHSRFCTTCTCRCQARGMSQGLFTILMQGLALLCVPSNSRLAKISCSFPKYFGMTEQALSSKVLGLFSEDKTCRDLV